MLFKHSKLPHYFMGNLGFKREAKGQQKKKDGWWVLSSCEEWKNQNCKLPIHTVQLRLRAIKGHTTGFGDAETPTNTAQPQRAGTNNTRTAPQASTVLSSFLRHSGGRGESSAPAPAPHRRSRPGSPWLRPRCRAPRDGENASGIPEGPSAGPGSGDCGKQELRRRRRRRSPGDPTAAAPRCPRSATGAAGLGAASPSQRHRCPAEAPFSPGRHTGMPP